MPQEALITIATRHQSHYERLKSAEVKKFDEFLVKMDKDMRELLTRSDITDFTRKKLERTLLQVRTLLRGSYDKYRKVWRDSVNAASVYEAGFEIRSLGQVVEGVNFSMPSDSQIISAVFNTPLGDIGGVASGAMLEPFFDGATDAQIKKVEGAIRMGYAQGETTQKIIQRIRGTKAAGYSDGIWAGSKRDIEAVTRTALQHASSQARQETWKENESVISKVRWVSALDSKTSAICRSLDGQEFPKDKGVRPPAHPNCRSTTVAVLNKKYADLSKGRTRSVRDPQTGKVGKAKADTTYYSWLKNQPASVQNSIIGNSRGKLLRNGGISSERFAELQLGKNFEPLNLEQMRKLDPVAFEKAGL